MQVTPLNDIQPDLSSKQIMSNDNACCHFNILFLRKVPVA